MAKRIFRASRCCRGSIACEAGGKQYPTEFTHHSPAFENANNYRNGKIVSGSKSVKDDLFFVFALKGKIILFKQTHHSALLFICFFLPCFLQANASQTNEQINHYQKMIKALQSSDAVLPSHPPVHPLKTVYNREAIIPPMCYTKTQRKHNPCYVCHQNALPKRENTMNDGQLQRAYSFSDQGMRNHWKNLFEDRRERIKTISDEAISTWVKEDNYSELAPRLETANFKGWIPDLADLQQGASAFHENGFAKDGSHWVAFNYKPFPSTFWPTNGSTDDVMIRLEKTYRSDEDGNYSEAVYRANLAIVEANIKDLPEITTAPLDENILQADLNEDGKWGLITRISKLDQYVGAAKAHFMQPGTYPLKTEFIHTVRYLDTDAKGNVIASQRMKEVRYLKKWVNYPLVSLREFYREEAYAKDEGYLPGYSNLRDYGLDNGMGWAVQGFIEGVGGQLRAYTYEENLSCMGCHSSIGSTIDKTFAFPRKVDGAKGWGYIDLKKMSDAPNRGEKQGEILTYLQRVSGGSEFRHNDEMQQRWFHKNGKVNKKSVQQAKNVYELITPSAKRAKQLNKAYRLIVEDQDFIYGKDASVTPPESVHQRIDNDGAGALPESLYYDWDIRLNWPQ